MTIVNDHIVDMYTEWRNIYPGERTMTANSFDDMQRLVAKSEIQDVLLRYARGVDRRDWDMVRAAYHDGATDLHGDFDGDADGVVAFIQARHRDGGQAMHFLGNCLIEFLRPDTALVETYFSSRRIGPFESDAMRNLAEGSDISDLDVLGRYLDHFAKRDGGWRIARRIVVYEAVRHVAARTGKTSPGWIWAGRDPSDALHRLREEIMRSLQGL